jgi:hypothetical protein
MTPAFATETIIEMTEHDNEPEMKAPPGGTSPA